MRVNNRESTTAGHESTTASQPGHARSRQETPAISSFHASREMKHETTAPAVTAGTGAGPTQPGHARSRQEPTSYSLAVVKN